MLVSLSCVSNYPSNPSQRIRALSLKGCTVYLLTLNTYERWDSASLMKFIEKNACILLLNNDTVSLKNSGSSFVKLTLQLGSSGHFGSITLAHLYIWIEVQSGIMSFVPYNPSHAGCYYHRLACPCTLLYSSFPRNVDCVYDERLVKFGNTTKTRHDIPRHSCLVGFISKKLCTYVASSQRVLLYTAYHAILSSEGQRGTVLRPS